MNGSLYMKGRGLLAEIWVRLSSRLYSYATLKALLYYPQSFSQAKVALDFGQTLKGLSTVIAPLWSDGKELLALFVNRDTKAWVARTPTGYYKASSGGEGLVGWHVNRG